MSEHVCTLHTFVHTSNKAATVLLPSHLHFTLSSSTVCMWELYIIVTVRKDSMSIASANAVLSARCNRFVGYL